MSVHIRMGGLCSTATVVAEKDAIQAPVKDTISVAIDASANVTVDVTVDASAIDASVIDASAIDASAIVVTSQTDPVNVSGAEAATYDKLIETATNVIATIQAADSNVTRNIEQYKEHVGIAEKL